MMLAIALAAIAGAAIGSFLNVCIHRLPLGQSIVWPGSACPTCKGAVAWYDNIPILSWLVLGARCRSCRARISIRYPIVEALTSVMCAGALWYYGPGALFLSRFVFGCALVVLFAIDLEHQILPNVITVPGIVAGLAVSPFVEPGWRSALMGALLGGGLLWLVSEAYFRLRSAEGLGFGDVKMLAMIGAFLGWRQVWVVLFLASISGAIIGVLVTAGRGRSVRTRLPFGTFLAIAAFVASLTGEGVLNWYLGLWG